MSKDTRYLVYQGHEVISTKSNLLDATEVYNKLPSGEGKRAFLRRSLVKETTIIEDKR